MKNNQHHIDFYDVVLNWKHFTNDKSHFFFSWCLLFVWFFYLICSCIDSRSNQRLIWYHLIQLYISHFHFRFRICIDIVTMSRQLLYSWKLSIRIWNRREIKHFLQQKYIVFSLKILISHWVELILTKNIKISVRFFAIYIFTNKHIRFSLI